ncbi:hypothetical protein AVEN_135065-1 [Araneus ventricosus]|uniref:Uncharacterized protein n=1 Tax=Araneus ventricosus TaxID=182803 RepID=A0A4Y2CZ04_ARAVE|nr:hypothetical protein AVEN_135065-1 [Araneus ventricosus]
MITFGDFPSRSSWTPREVGVWCFHPAFSVAQWGRGGSGPVRVGDAQRVMTTGTRVFRHSVPLVCKFWVGRPEDVRSVPLAVLALVSRFLYRPLPFLPMS